MSRLPETPSQTAGPYVHIGLQPETVGLPWPQGPSHRLWRGDTPGERIVLDIGLFDGAGEPVRDALIELWQADSLGHHHAPGWLGWGRAAADAADGRYRFETIKPGAVPPRAPFVSLFIVARGINLGLHTRVYFEGDELGRDPLLQRLGARAGRLLATRRDDGMGWGLDLHLAGPQEAVFLEAAAG